MPDRYIALCDGKQAGEAGFRRQQVVKTRIELLLGDPKTDMKQLALEVVQELEISFPGKLIADVGHSEQAVRCIVNDRAGVGTRAIRL